MSVPSETRRHEGLLALGLTLLLGGGRHRGQSGRQHKADAGKDRLRAAGIVRGGTGGLSNDRVPTGGTQLVTKL